MTAVEILAGAAALLIGLIVLGIRSWGPELEGAELEREAEDRARAYFDEHGHWPEPEEG